MGRSSTLKCANRIVLLMLPTSDGQLLCCNGTGGQGSDSTETGGFGSRPTKKHRRPFKQGPATTHLLNVEKLWILFRNLTAYHLRDWRTIILPTYSIKVFKSDPYVDHQFLRKGCRNVEYVAHIIGHLNLRLPRICMGLRSHRSFAAMPGCRAP